IGRRSELSGVARHDHPARAGVHHTRRHARDPARHDCTGAGIAMSEMRNDLLKTVDRIFDARCQKPVRESAEAGEWPAALWQALEEVGVDRAALPEEAGGSGLDFEDAMLALRRSAYHGAPGPLAETMLAGRLLAAAGIAVPGSALTVAPVRRGDRLEAARSAALRCEAAPRVRGAGRREHAPRSRGRALSQRADGRRTGAHARVLAA